MNSFNYEFNYCLTEKDVESFLISNAKSPYFKPLHILMWLAPLLYAIPAYLLSGNFDYFGIAVFIYILMVISYPISMRIVKRLNKNRIKTHPSQYSINELQSLIINEHGIINKNDYKKLTLAWNDLKYITHDVTNVYIYLSLRKVIIIPKRLFKSNTEYNNFINTLLSFA